MTMLFRLKIWTKKATPDAGKDWVFAHFCLHLESDALCWKTGLLLCLIIWTEIITPGDRKTSLLLCLKSWTKIATPGAGKRNFSRLVFVTTVQMDDWLVIRVWVYFDNFGYSKYQPRCNLLSELNLFSTLIFQVSIREVLKETCST